MIIPIHFQPTEEKHHVLDFHSDNCSWLHVGETGRTFRDGQGIGGLVVPRSTGYRRAGDHAALAKTVCAK